MTPTPTAGGSLVGIIGEPTTPSEVTTLAAQDKFQFQWWALGLVGARPVEQKKGADHGIEAKVFFRDDPRASKAEQIISQVKSGKTGVDHVRDLRGVLDREQAAMGVLITLQPPTKPMEIEAASLGFYEHKLHGQKYPHLQIRTVRELMDGQGIQHPTSAAAVDVTFTRAPKARTQGQPQSALGLGSRPAAGRLAPSRRLSQQLTRTERLYGAGLIVGPFEEAHPAIAVLEQADF